MNHNVLILGASGLLGQSLIDFFSLRNYKIGAVSRKSIKYENPNVKAYISNILTEKNLEEIISQYDTVINCIGQITNPINECLLLNTDGINNIINAVKKHDKHLIHISSVAVYGTSQYVDETSELNPETPYGTIKCFSEFLIRKSLIKYTILRVSNLFGENQKKGIINYLENSYLSNKGELYFNNNGDLKRYYLHTEDLSMFVYEAMQKNLIGIYNVIGDEQFSIKRLVTNFEKILGITFNVHYASNLSSENIDIIDCSKIQRQINIKCKMSVFTYIRNLKK